MQHKVDKRGEIFEKKGKRIKLKIVGGAEKREMGSL